MRKIKILMMTLCAAFMAFGMVSSASALTINAGDLPTSPWSLGSTYWTGTDTDNMNAEEIATAIGYGGTLFEWYKQDVGSSSDEGPFAESYNTVFSNTDGEGDLGPEAAEITWLGEPLSYMTGDPIYLYVKDGNHEPAWYIFNLAAVPWDGKDTIILEDFWDGSGSISHIALLGNYRVPEPMTLILLGFGLLGLAGIRRK